MSTQALVLLLFCASALLLGLRIGLHPYLVAYRRQRIVRHPFPGHWRKILQRRVPLVRKLPVDMQLQLKKLMQIFIAEKAFIGCAGLQVTDEMRVVIAAQACLLILNRPSGYFRNLRQILVYPGAFAVDRVHTDGGGVLQEQRQALSGESWSQGQVILSWQDSLAGAAVADDGHNVVIHEFAHQLDQENGSANGAPPRSRLEAEHNPQRWSAVFHAAYSHLQHEQRTGQHGLLNHYGAKNPAEFFAVVSEVFFEQPAALAQHYPDLYRELSGYYRLDPVNWQ